MTANAGALADPGRISEKLPMVGHYLSCLFSLAHFPFLHQLCCFFVSVLIWSSLYNSLMEWTKKAVPSCKHQNNKILAAKEQKYSSKACRDFVDAISRRELFVYLWVILIMHNFTSVRRLKISWHWTGSGCNTNRRYTRKVNAKEIWKFNELYFGLHTVPIYTSSTV